jgi:hypothetical protein
MKNLKLMTALFLLVVLAACENEKINPSSNITTQDRTIEEYTGIAISTVFTVDVTISDTEEKIEIEANENLHAYIDVYEDGGNLVIKIKDKTSIQGSATLKAHITTANPLSVISVSDASQLFMNNNLVTNTILLDVDGASSLHGDINAAEMEVRLAGASDLSLKGATGQLDLFAYDASDLAGLDFVVEDLKCVLEGAAKASLTVNKTIDITAEGASSLTYRGDAVITNIDMDDASQINKIN